MPTNLDEPTIIRDKTVTPEQMAATSFGELLEQKLKVPETKEEPPVVAAPAKEAAKAPVKEAAKVELKPTPLDFQPPKPAVEVDDAELEKVLKAEPPANASAAAKSNWSLLRKGIEREKAHSAKLSAALEELKTKAAAPSPELETALKTEREAREKLETEFERVAFERSPRFQKFIKAGEEELTAAKLYLEGTEVDPNAIELASKATGAKRIQILSDAGMEPAMIGAITSHLARIDAINRDKGAAQENWKGQQAQWEQEQKSVIEKQQAQLRAREEQVFSTVAKQISENIPAARRVEGNEEWNKGVDERSQLAKDAFGGKLPLEKTSEILLKGTLLDITEAARVDAVKKCNDLVIEMGRIKAASPGIGTTRGDKTTGVSASTNPMKAAEDTFNAMQAQRSQ